MLFRSELPRIDLVVTDSQIFSAVAEIVPKDMRLTSFSILMARQKGNFQELYESGQAIRTLKPGDKVLISEACTHNTSHEDIGRVKIPRALEKLAGGKLEFRYSAGLSFPDDLTEFALVVHCGGCMLTQRMFAARQNAAKRQNVPFTNYGLTLAFCAGVPERSVSGLV